MFNYDIKFLTCDESLYIKKNHFNIYKYETRKKSDESVYDIGKRSFCENRGGQWRAIKPRQIRQLDSKLRERSIVACKWTNENIITLILSSGAIVYLTLKSDTLDVVQILIDKYCIGKLAEQVIVDAVISNSHLLFTHPDRLATLVTFGKCTSSSLPNRICDRDPQLQTIEIGSALRRAERRLSWQENGSTLGVLVWCPVAKEPAPWSPGLKDNANLHIYQITGSLVTLITYHQLENETLLAELSPLNPNTVHIVEQACHKNGVSVEWSRYSIPTGPGGVGAGGVCGLTRAGAVRVSVSAPARAASRDRTDVRLLLACIDGTLHVLHHASGLTHSAKPGFIASVVRWCGEVVVCGEERGRLQCFDRALSPLQNHSRPNIDIAAYAQPRESRRVHILATKAIKRGVLILAVFAGGPLALVRITHPHLLSTWIRQGQLKSALALLRSMDWESEGCECLRGVTRLVQCALRAGIDGEEVAVAALGVFLAPAAPHTALAMRYAPHVHDVARKFFHHLLRRGRIEKALSLAVDLHAWDLFVDCACCARRLHRADLADEAHALALTHYRPDSECSDLCSQCSSSTSSSRSVEDTITSSEAALPPPPLPRVRPAPIELPSLMPVLPPRTPHEPPSTISIRPNLHQYLERENTIWNIEIKNDTARFPRNKNSDLQNSRQSVDMLFSKHNMPKQNSIISINDMKNRKLLEPKRQHEVTPGARLRNIHQTELKEDSNIIYRYYSNDNQQSSVAMNSKVMRSENNNCERSQNKPHGEKHKVKFSDTVTVTVVTSDTKLSGCGRESTTHKCPAAQGALSSGPGARGAPSSHAAPSGSTLDYVEV